MKVLCVDDERNILEYHVRRLKEIETVEEVFAFGKSKDAIAFARENSVDVALLDISMPIIDGITMAKALKKLLPEISIIFVTGYSEYKKQATDMGCSGYLMKPASAQEIRKELDFVMHKHAPQTSERMRVQCFGDFDVFVDGKPVPFKLSKSKELLAYLIDRKGSRASSGEICAVLWEDTENEEKEKAYFRRCWLELKESLDAVGMGNVLVKSWNSYAVDPAAFWCDVYAFEKGDLEAINSFHGEYMMQYSWGEMRVADFY